MAIFVDGQEIKQIMIGGEGYIHRVYYGSDLVFEAGNLFESNVPLSKTVYLSPGIYEIVAVGGSGGSIGLGSGGGGSYSSGTIPAVGGN